MTELPYPIRPPQRPYFPSHCQWSGDNRLFSPQECEAIIRVGLAQGLSYATIGNGDNAGGVVNLDYRCVRSSSLFRFASAADLTWVYERIAGKVELANEAYFRFDLTGLGEPIQFLRYEVNQATPAGHYHWHQDFGGGYSSNRKLSMVVQLTGPEDYEGCRLELMNEKVWEAPYIGQGEACMFPSWTPHQVTAITRGVRHALAVWIHGPQFR